MTSMDQMPVLNDQTSARYDIENDDGTTYSLTFDKATNTWSGVLLDYSEAAQDWEDTPITAHHAATLAEIHRFVILA